MKRIFFLAVLAIALFANADAQSWKDALGKIAGKVSEKVSGNSSGVSLYSDSTTLLLEKIGSSIYAFLRYIGSMWDIHPLQWMISGAHLSFFTVSRTPLAKKTALSPLSSKNFPFSSW